MDSKNPSSGHLTDKKLPFPLSWIKDDPRAVEASLEKMSIEEQARIVLQAQGQQRQDLLILSPQALEVAHALPKEEFYHMVKEAGENEAPLVLSMASSDQLQYMFDLEWWMDDRFRPGRALNWLLLLDECDESSLLEWFLSEDFDQRVVLMQSLIKVYKRDEMTDTLENVDDMEHFTPDGVYQIFFKVAQNEPIKKLLLLLRSQEEQFFYALMEAVIWSPLTLTVESAYRWRMTRVAESGIPEFDEAFGIYSQLNPEWLKLESHQEVEPGFSEEARIAPQYPLTQADASLFFSSCLSLLDDEKRLELIRWELVGLANKVMVADRRDPSLVQDRLDAMQKALGYVNIGLELGADGDQEKGKKLLGRTWMRFLFQAGYSRIKKLKWQAQKFLRENKTWVDSLINTSDREQLSALIYRFPQIGKSPGLEASLEWKDFETLEEVQSMEQFINRGVFFARFFRQCLDLSPSKVGNFIDESSIPENNEDVDLLVWATTALARFILFQEISCEPLQEAAARSFLEIIFLTSIYKEDQKVCDEARMNSFHQQLLKAPMAWTEKDLELLMELLIACRENLERQFGKLDPKGKIEWKFTRALLIRL